MTASPKTRSSAPRTAAASAPAPGGAEERLAASASPVAGAASTLSARVSVEGPRTGPGQVPASLGDGARSPREVGSSPRTWVLEFPAGMKLLSLNDHSHWRVRYSRGEVIRKAAWALARAAHVPPLQRIAVSAEYQPPDRRKRDEDNLTLSVKSVIDGIKAAGVVLDDSSEYVRYDGCRIGERYPKGRLVITVTEIAP